MRPNTKRDAMSDTTVAPIKMPVPQNMPARALTMKKTTSGPTSTASFQRLRLRISDGAASSLLVASSPMSVSLPLNVHRRCASSAYPRLASCSLGFFARPRYDRPVPADGGRGAVRGAVAAGAASTILSAQLRNAIALHETRQIVRVKA